MRGVSNKRSGSSCEPITGRLSEGLGWGNYRPFVGGQAVTNWPESGVPELIFDAG